MKIVINSCYGGFSLSPAAMKAYYAKKGRPCYFFKGINEYEMIQDKDLTNERNMSVWTAFDVENPTSASWGHNYLDSRPDNRTDPDLISAIEAVGLKESSGSCADLRIIEIPDDIKYEIDDYDGIETIHERHQTWS